MAGVKGKSNNNVRRQEMNIKWRPSILLISTGLVVGLVYAVMIGYTEAVTGIIGVLGAAIAKLVESEEKG